MSEQDKTPKLKIRLKTPKEQPKEEPKQAPAPKLKIRLKVPKPKEEPPKPKEDPTPKLKVRLKVPKEEPKPKEQPKPSVTKKPTPERKEQQRTIKDKLSRASSYEISELRKQSKSWFNSEVQKLAKSNDATIKGTTTLKPEIGVMYSFYYDAKLKDTLPYWDKFPLVFPFRILPDGFIGINFHYVHYKDRIILLDELQSIAVSTRTDVSTKLKLSYSLLQKMAHHKKFQKCVHRYLFNHLRTPLKKIHSDKWIVACLLPNEMFTGATAKQVWSY